MTAARNLKQAIEDNELDYFYQPQVSLVTGEIVGAEALARWIRPDGRTILPGAFIPLAEETGLITEVTLRLFKRLERSLQRIQEIKPLRVAFNVTADDLETDRLTEEIIDAVKEKRLTPDSLEIEITESKLIKSRESVKRNLNRIVDAGLGIAMDDFGTGYSSLNVLADYPFSVLKLDYRLINGITGEIKKKFIAKTAVRMAHLLKIDVVAEGVENRQQYDLLQYMGCTTVQGFWISEPLPLDDFIDFISREQRYPRSAAGQLHMMSVDHLLWYRDMVYYAMAKLQKKGSRSAASPLPPPRNYMFAEWFYKKGKPALSKSLSGRHIKELEELHLRIHDEARRIIETLEQGSETTGDYSDILTDFNRLHQDLTRKLQECENTLVYNYLSSLH